ncbi:unnamed protein product [Clonostachys rosea]|uniref:Rhodopsin domain-containing protein n=1 Tax=Bionectria ochroleuca TaxID=29856 RepID=A0ABY6U8A5_BIOOC|nr:unnamed protein product [Clonostachys rosea]
MGLGVLAAIVDFCFLIPQMYVTPQLLTHEERINARKYAFLAIPVWGIAMTFIKISIAMMLLIIQENILWWRIFCYFVMGLQGVYGVGNTFFILLQCRPLEASWNVAILKEVGGSCLPSIGINIASNIGSGINIATDILLSLAPTLFLWKLRRPLREKILVGCLMALGMFASVASIIKAMLVKEFGKAPDAWALTNAIATWTALEQLLGMIAASSPFLKPLVQSALQLMGVSINDSKTGPSAYANRYHGLGENGTKRSNRNSVRQSMLNRATSQRERPERIEEEPWATSSSAAGTVIQLETRRPQAASAPQKAIKVETTTTIRVTEDGRPPRSLNYSSDGGSEKHDLAPTQAPRQQV